MLRKVFERDLDALEQMVLHIVKPCVLHVYNNGGFALSVYIVRHDGSMGLYETLATGYDDAITLEFERMADGFIIDKHLIHGDDSHESVAADCSIINNDVQYLVITANEAVTVKYYER